MPDREETLAEYVRRQLRTVGRAPKDDRDRLVRTINDPTASVQDRVAAGDQLAAMGDRRPGVGLRADGLPDVLWCDVPAGPFVFGGDDKAFRSGPGSRINLSAFRMAKYPVTFSQFNAFIDAEDGYRNAEWWSRFHESGRKQRHDGPGDQAFKFGNRPRERVSWYDAMAFCRWLSAVLGYEITLPTEQQWEKAARGPDGRFYPHGNEFDISNANTHETSIGQTSAVGIFPAGASPYGVMDMSGNVWEWTLSEWETGSDANVGSGAARVLRGGSWHDTQYGARAAFRLDDGPVGRGRSVGFRLASPASL
jgi:formylglycine-generating enzyme required for sulfatase activity